MPPLFDLILDRFGEFETERIEAVDADAAWRRLPRSPIDTRAEGTPQAWRPDRRNPWPRGNPAFQWSARYPRSTRA